MEKQAKLLELNKRWTERCTCALKETATQAVPGTGSAEADLVFIGEAPGKDEDEQGKPFVGAAGKFLGQMLHSVGIERSDVYITNVVKYRPPNNRDPLPDEVAACWPWLEEQIHLIQPKLLVLLGRHALERFFPEEKISQVHGKLLKRHIKGIDTGHFYALYHPAAALYNGGMRGVLMEDFGRIPKILEMITTEQVKKKDDETPPLSTQKADQQKLF